MRVIARCEMCGRIVDGVVDKRVWGYAAGHARPDVTVEVLGQMRTLCPSCAALPAEEIVAKLTSTVTFTAGVANPSAVPGAVTLDGKNLT